MQICQQREKERLLDSLTEAHLSTRATLDDVSYFTNDGYGHNVVDSITGEQHASTKADVGMMVRINDYLSSMSISWTMISALDCSTASPLHEVEIIKTKCILSHHHDRRADRYQDFLKLFWNRSIKEKNV